MTAEEQLAKLEGEYIADLINEGTRIIEAGGDPLAEEPPRQAIAMPVEDWTEGDSRFIADFIDQGTIDILTAPKTYEGRISVEQKQAVRDLRERIKEVHPTNA